MKIKYIGNLPNITWWSKCGWRELNFSRRGFGNLRFQLLSATTTIPISHTATGIPTLWHSRPCCELGSARLATSWTFTSTFEKEFNNSGLIIMEPSASELGPLYCSTRPNSWRTSNSQSLISSHPISTSSSSCYAPTRPSIYPTAWRSLRNISEKHNQDTSICGCSNEDFVYSTFGHNRHDDHKKEYKADRGEGHHYSCHGDQEQEEHWNE